MAGLGALHFVVVRPPAGLATAIVYGVCRVATQPQTAGPLVEALRQRDWKQVARRVFNRLQPAAEALSPWVKRLQQEFAQLDFLGYGMSGSGTSYFGLCRHARQARRSARRLETYNLGSVFALRSCR